MRILNTKHLLVMATIMFLATVAGVYTSTVIKGGSYWILALQSLFTLTGFLSCLLTVWASSVKLPIHTPKADVVPFDRPEVTYPRLGDRRGFTLIELLVVIVILVAVVSILTPIIRNLFR